MNVYKIASYHDLADLSVSFSGKRTMWGLSPVAPLHLGYDPLFELQAELRRLGAEPRILLADVHATLSHALSESEIATRAKYYRDVIVSVFELEAEIVLGSGLHFSNRYTTLLYSLMQKFTIGDAKQAASAAAKGARETIDRFVYPIMQCVDAIVSAPDIIVAERSQEKIYRLLAALTEDERFADLHPWLSSIVFIYVNSAHDLTGQRIQLSTHLTRISYHDGGDVLEQKVLKIFAPPALMEMHEKQNCLLEIFRYSVYPMAERIGATTLPFATYAALEAAYLDGQYHPGDAKTDLLHALKLRHEWFAAKLPAGSADWIRRSV